MTGGNSSRVLKNSSGHCHLLGGFFSSLLGRKPERLRRGPGFWMNAMEETRPELPDYLAPGLEVVFVGFNPGDRSSRLGHYYAGRGNQFWNFLYESGLVPRRLGPEDDASVVEFGLGLTDVVKRWSKSSGDLGVGDYCQGIPRLAAKLEAAAPLVVAFNGKGAYEKYAGRPAELGWQRDRAAGSRVFVLPSTSGRNGSLTRAAKLAYFLRLARWVQSQRRANGR